MSAIICDTLTSLGRGNDKLVTKTKKRLALTSCFSHCHFGDAKLSNNDNSMTSLHCPFDEGKSSNGDVLSLWSTSFWRGKTC